MGADSLREFHRWKGPARILGLATLVVASRPGHSELGLSEMDSIASGAAQRVVRLEGPAVDISGQEVRRRIAQGLSVRYQVCDAVRRYIKRHNLYREE